MQNNPEKVKHETEIVWLKPKENYAYLREGIMQCSQRERFPLKSYDPSKHTDGGPLAHFVAYAVLSPSAKRDSWASAFERRYWWVKGYDRFIGNDQSKNVYRTGAPTEAVDVATIKAGQLSEGWEKDANPISQS